MAVVEGKGGEKEKLQNDVSVCDLVNPCSQKVMTKVVES